MNLDKLTVEIRPRRPWEAVDLGFLLARRHWVQLFCLWSLLTWPLFVALAFLPMKLLWLQPLLLWWCKPLFERPLLYILSRTVFGEFPSTREALRAFPSLARQQVFTSLLWRRFSPSRSTDLPVLQLEGLAGAARRQRLDVLHREGTGPASWLTIYGIHVESFLTFGLAGLAFALVPMPLDLAWQDLYTGLESRSVNLAFNALTLLCASAVAPFYVATGFALYLNRRIKLEAWDVEIAFKRIVARRQAPPQGQAQGPLRRAMTVAMSLLLACVLGVSFPGELQARPGDGEKLAEWLQGSAIPPVDDADSAREAIDAVKALPVFNGEKIDRDAHFKFEKWFEKWREEEEEDEARDLDLSIFQTLGRFFKALANYGEVLLWLVVILLVLWFVYRYRHWWERWTGIRLPQRRRRNPTVLFGMEVTKESLPEHVGDSARQLWLQGEGRQALALLYRACLFHLMEFGVDFCDGDTEGVCLAKVRQAKHLQPLVNEERRAYFQRLTGLWQRFAYGHVAPAEAEVLALCEGWPALWPPRGEVSRDAH